jgi:hypothetical protein
LVEPDAQLQRSGRKAAFLLLPDSQRLGRGGVDMISLCGNPKKVQLHPGIIRDQ